MSFGAAGADEDCERISSELLDMCIMGISGSSLPCGDCSQWLFQGFRLGLMLGIPAVVATSLLELPIQLRKRSDRYSCRIPYMELLSY